MSEDEVEKFEITDYDLENEFSMRPRKRGLTKEQQIYGMWAETSDGEEGGGASRAGPSYSQPRFLQKGALNFVAGGIQQYGKKEEVKAKEEAEEDDEEEEELGVPRPMFRTHLDSSEEEEDHLPLELSRNKKNSGNNIGYGSQGGKSEKGDILAGFRRVQGIHSEGGIGNWEKHTTGIGSKLMKMMGYEEGKGLGKNLQGISTPVEAQKRKGKGAIGFYGSERTERSLKDYPEVDSEEEEKGKFEEQLQQWKKTGNKKKIQYIYKTTEEAILEGKNKKLGSKSDNHITKTKVIDMTGPETRVLSSYHALGNQKSMIDEYEEVKKKKFEHFDLPELLHNLQILMEKSEENIIRNAKTQDADENRIVHLNHEREKYELLLDREEKELKSLNDAIDLIDALQLKHNEKLLTLNEAFSVFSELKENYPTIYSSFEISYLAPTYLTPLFKEVFSTWNPLANPQQHIELVAQWRPLLELQVYPTNEDQPADPFQQLIFDTWASSLRSTILGSWEPRDCGPLITVFEIWVPPLIPLSIQTQLLQMFVMPRIARAVHNWNPREDTVPIHTWLHPWLPLLSEELKSVYPVIRQKLISALTMWHASDRSAKMVLQPWKGVFSDISMNSLIQSSIIPKLESSLHEMAICPNNQNLDAWHWFLDWEEMMHSQTILDILERCFFPRWYQALGSWLSANPPFAEVIAWYKGWRDIIPSKVINHQQVKQKFQQSLEILQRALSFQPNATEQIGLLLSGLEKLNDPPPPPPMGSPPRQRTKDWADIISTSSARRDNLSMKEMVERRCQENGIVFLPLPDRNHEGRPIYRCGNLNISFCKNIIYVQAERGWIPKSLTTLLDDAS